MTSAEVIGAFAPTNADLTASEEVDNKTPDDYKIDLNDMDTLRSISSSVSLSESTAAERSSSITLSNILEKKSKPRQKPKPRLPKRNLPSSELLDLSGFDGSNYTRQKYLESSIDRVDLSLLAHVFRHSKRLVVVSGAGISVAAGIPDFRSSDGLFAALRKELNLKTSGKALFDASVYRDEDSTSNFHTTVRDLYRLCAKAKPTVFHELLESVASENRLLRLYTQNIDCLDTELPHLTTKIPLAPPWPPVVQLHGTISTMVCSKCNFMSPLEPEIFINDGSIPDCPQCIELEGVRVLVGKRTHGIGKLRPRIVLYNEFNPDGDAIGQISETDLSSKPDGLIVVGTSLKIPGVKRIVREMAQAVHAARGAVIWMNTEHPQFNKREFEGTFDLLVKGDCQLIPQLLTDFESERQSKKKPRVKAVVNRQITDMFKQTKKRKTQTTKSEEKTKMEVSHKIPDGSVNISLEKDPHRTSP